MGCWGTTEKPSTFLGKTLQLVAKELVSGRRRGRGGRIKERSAREKVRWRRQRERAENKSKAG